MPDTRRKTLLRALAGETVTPPPVWLMRQAGRYLPEYRATRAQAGSFLDLCYTPELAAEVTLQPIRRFGFDAAILFADILLAPHALGRKLWFAEGEGPRLEPLSEAAEVAALRDDAALHAHLAPVYETLRIVKGALPRETTLIGFAGAPWTVATYMIAGRGKDEQRGALDLMRERPETFEALMRRLETATVAYLDAQMEAGAEAAMLFDSWAGALARDPALFRRWCLEPMERIAAALALRHPGTPLIAFPRGAGELYRDFVGRGFRALAIDEAVSPLWARDALQAEGVAVQGNLDPALLVEGGARLERAARGLVETLGRGPYIFNLGHGITPEADPRHVEALLRHVRA